MAPSRGKGKLKASTEPHGLLGSTRRSPRTTRKPASTVPDVYQDLLAEAAVNETLDADADRPLKKRRLVTSRSNKEHQVQDEDDTSGLERARHRQAIEASSDSDDSDFGFEDVDLNLPTTPANAESTQAIGDVTIPLGHDSAPKSKITIRHKPASLAEKARRLLVHKAHILCLLGHYMLVNTWCNDAEVQKWFEDVVDRKFRSYLNPAPTDSQFQRDRSFMEGLQNLGKRLHTHFQITASAMRRPQWPMDGQDFVSRSDVPPTSRSELVSAARKLQGSQDTANQLYCAALRYAGVEARLVCSLQPLPFAGSKRGSTPQKPAKPTIIAIASDTDPNASDISTDDASIATSARIGKVPSARRRLGQPAFAAEPAGIMSPVAVKKPIRKLAYPTFWVEAFNTVQQKWIPVDPIVTQTVNKPSKLEPPSSYESNQLTYVFAFESTGVVRDVTRRYAKAYNAKTRRQRVEATEQGAQWLKRALRIFRRRGPPLDREQVEDAELAQREAREPMPGNVQDFKDHPYYALERHLRWHEVLQPRREVGKVNAGTAAKPRMEPVFRRQDVKVCRSADKWYRMGREVKQGEQALKRITARSSRRDEDEDENAKVDRLTPLYAEDQTQLYVPPPIVRGRVPRNAFGNLDIYVPSMVPSGGVHIRHRLTQQAARTLRLDFADAVTGFSFKGRHGSAIIQGAVVAAKHADAVRAAIAGLEEEQVEEESRARSLAALRLWRRFLTGLRIAERVSAYGDASDGEQLRQELDEQEEKQEETEDGGGFVLNEAEEMAMPTAGRFTVRELVAPASRPTKKGKRRAIESEAEYEVSEEDRDEGMPDLNNEPKERDDDEGNADEGGGQQGDGGFLREDEAKEDDTGDGFFPDPNAADELNSCGFPLVPDADSNKHDVAHAQGHTIHVEPTTENMDIETEGDQCIRAIPSTADELAPSETLMSGALQVGSPQSRSHSRAHGLSDRIPSADAVNEELQSGTQMVIDSDGITSNRSSQAGKDMGRGSEHGSMLSHDPEDDDAEPDWLESD